MSSPSLEAARRLLLQLGDAEVDESLYAHWFHDSAGEEREFPQPGAYRSATHDPSRFEGEWRVVEAGPNGLAGAAVVRRGDSEQRQVAPPHCIPARPDRLGLEPGDELLVDPLSQSASGGFWHLWSRPWAASPPAAIQRLYFSVREGAELAFSRAFAAAAPPDEWWALKLLTGRHPRGRRDKAVAYLEAGRPLDRGWVHQCVLDVEPLLEHDPPPFTRHLRLGVSWAEDPGSGLSFGQHVCRLLATVSRQPGALDSAENWAGAVAREFERHGLDVARPELCALAGRIES